MTLLMKQAEFAARHNVGAPAVSNWKKRGLLVFADDPARPGKKLIDVEKSDLLVRGTIDPTRGRPRREQTEAAQAAPAGAAAAAPLERQQPKFTGLEAIRLEEMTEKVIRRRLENAQLVGSLVPLAEYERRSGDMGRLVRERSHATIRQHAERLAAETDPRVVIAILSEAFDALFGQLADEIEAQASAEQAADAALERLGAVELDDPPELDGA